jgi:hypothetical protein
VLRHRWEPLTPWQTQNQNTGSGPHAPERAPEQGSHLVSSGKTRAACLTRLLACSRYSSRAYLIRLEEMTARHSKHLHFLQTSFVRFGELAFRSALVPSWKMLGLHAFIPPHRSDTT